MPGWFRKPPADPSPASRGPSCLSPPLLSGCSHFDYYNQTTLERNGKPSLATTVGVGSKGRLPLLTGLEDSTHAGSSLDITVPFCRCLRRRPLIGGPPKRKVWSLYTVLQKAYYALEHLDDLFRPLLFSLCAAMHLKLLNVPHLLQLAQVALLIVHRFSSRCCTNIASSIMGCFPSSWSNCS